MGRLVQSNGWVGVYVFFVLSGFLITTLLLRERERFGRVDVRAFWVRRALRIWPLYYLAIAVGFGIYPWFCEGITPGSWLRSYGVQLPAFLGFLGNWSMAARGPLPEPINVLWSICVEEQFYLFIPLLVATLAPRWRAAVVASLIGLAIVGRYQMAASGIKEAALRYNSLANLDTLLAGVSLALVADGRPSILRPAWPWRLLVASGTLAVVSVPLCQGGPMRVAFDQVLIWAWAAALVVMAASPEGRRLAVLRRPMIVWLGRISYDIYLSHELVMGLILWLGLHTPQFPEKWLILSLLAPLTTIALAAASYRWLERPFLEYKRRWTRVPSRPIGLLTDQAGPGPPDLPGPTSGRSS